MKAITVENTRLCWSDVAEPEPRAGEVLIQVQATAVNRADLLQRAGRYPPPPGASPILGLEAAGEVIALGEGVQSSCVGDRVCCLLAGGGYAERVTCPQELLLPIPEGLSFTEAAALPEALYTAYLNLWIEGRLQVGQTALIHAAASGIGTMALQLCRALGSPAIGTASAKKLDAIRAYGAVGLDRDDPLLWEAIRAICPDGVATILDPVGGTRIASNLALLGDGGTLVVIGLLGGTTASVPLDLLLRRRLRLVGSVLRGRSTAEKAALTAEIRQRLWPLVATGAIGPVIDRVLPIEQADRAHELLRGNVTVGKIVLQVGGSQR